MKVIKKQGKIVNAYRLGSESEVMNKLIEEGKLIPRKNGTYEVMSQESDNGSGQVAREGDYVKIDSTGSPYPNDAAFFNANHRHIEGDTYEQIPKPLLAWTVDEHITEEISFLIAHKGLVLNDKSPDKYFTAPLWGTIEASPRDSVLVFYSVSRNDAGEIIDADFNFVARAEFEKTYTVLEEADGAGTVSLNRVQNIVLFSSGISEENGILAYIKSELERAGYSCSYWRDLFSHAKDATNIALLPMLIKKIPSFDFAVLICEGHDRTIVMRGAESLEVPTMRDNVLFEVGLCAMALGPNRTILLCDGKARLPEDLAGTDGKSAVHVISYDPAAIECYADAAKEVVQTLNMERFSALRGSVKDISDYIDRQCGVLSPTIIGAAVSLANGYMSNFILRTLEKINEGIRLNEADSDELRFFADDKIFFHVLLPTEYTPETPAIIKERKANLPKACIPSARFRPVELNYRIHNDDELHIYDYPTTLVTGYQTARMILRIDADDSHDIDAERRFNAKELDLFEHALRSLLNKDYIRETVTHFYSDDTFNEENAMIERLFGMISRVTVERV
ncbi:MAG: nucleotide-binding protein [Clostridia bacterium]|nr:nucleotide-binding protein [Clostridia bacterium]